MNTRSFVNAVLVVSGLLSIVSGLMIWLHLSMGTMKPLHINASLLMAVACLWHVWLYRKSLLQTLKGHRGMVTAVITLLLVGVSVLMSDPAAGRGKGRGPGPRAEISASDSFVKIPL